MTTTPGRGGDGIAPATVEGWFVLHQSARVDWASLKSLEPGEARAALEGFARLAERWAVDAEPGWSGVYRMAGGGVDILLVHFRDSLERLMTARHELSLSAWGDHAIIAEEHLSVVELGLYGLTRKVSALVSPDERETWEAALEEAKAAERAKGYVRRRLEPRQPEHMPYVCAYPMDKRRGRGQNWYSLPLDERARLMAAHGSVGRRFAGRILQVIGGSLGLADWEWSVTLWASDPLAFKAIITEMRYDEASAEYAEFGPFLVGRRMTGEDIASLLPARGV